MAVVQGNFYIPDDIYSGVLTGMYKITDGVVRHALGPNKGQIVKHLKIIDSPTPQEAKGVVQAGLHIIKQNKTAAIVVGAVAGLGTVGAITYRKLKSREPKVLMEFRTALRNYITAIRNAEMSLEIIENMTTALENLRVDVNYEKYNIQLTAEEVGVLVGNIKDYTMQLATDNNVEISEEEMVSSDDAIINLKNYLDIQRKIFDEAA